MDMLVVEFDTTFGQIKIELNAEKAPITVTNFLDYVESGHYDGLIFHRVINHFGTVDNDRLSGYISKIAKTTS
ncbi:peptidylprolyl isomerase [Moraxella catarrhalis]|uniref:peptidylprolyl isomerase n=1 Tax=Moraxella catarrhalis TaxID=480 RepID=UPI0038734DCE